VKVLDEDTRECLAMLVAPSMGSRKVIDVLEWLFLTRGAPGHLRSDNGPEFIAYAFQDWLAERHCQTLYITPDSPWENPFIESFKGHFRTECLDRSLVANGREAQLIIEDWRLDYNRQRPHSSLGYLTPAEFAQTTNISLKQVV
jgi:transposase InsO family protein